jgi:hypothetical protein
VSRLGSITLICGLSLAAVVLVAPTLATSVTPIPTTDPAIAVLAPPPISAEPLPAAGAAAAMVAAASKAKPANMTLGTAVLDMETGEIEDDGTDQFYSASLSKLMLIVDMLDRNVDMPASTVTAINRALSLSDDNAMNMLWTKYGGPAAMTRVAENLDMPDTETPDDPSQWGETLISPAGFIRLYQHILTEMDPADRAVIVDGLRAAEPEAADGYNQFFGLLGQPGDIYAKQGWMFYGSKLYLHSAGVVHDDDRDYVVVMMSYQPATSSAQRSINNVAKAMLSAMTADS